MKSSGDEMLAAITEARGIVETNREATQEMGATSAQVTEAVASIASVAEENSASTEQVSAAAEEMSAQVEEVNAASDQLGEMAESLQQQVDRFKLSEAAAGSGGLRRPLRPTLLSQRTTLKTRAMPRRSCRLRTPRNPEFLEADVIETRSRLKLEEV